jgi:hypothetical protein
MTVCSRDGVLEGSAALRHEHSRLVHGRREGATRSGRATRSTVRTLYLLLPSHANVPLDQNPSPPNLAYS